MKHILILPSALDDYKYKTGGAFVKSQIKALRKAGYKVGVIYPNLRSLRTLPDLHLQAYFYKFKEIDNEGQGLELRLNGWRFGFNLWTNLLNFKYWYKKLFEKYIESEGIPDIIHCHFGRWAGYGGFILKSTYNIPYLITEQSTGYRRGLFSKSELSLLSEIFNKSSEIIVSSKQLAKDISSLTNKSIKIIGNIIDLEGSENLKINKNKEDFKIVTLAYLLQKKGIDLLIEAFGLLLSEARLPNSSKLLIGGEGPEKEILVRKVSDLNLMKNVSFLGEVNRSEIVNFLYQADVFCLPSRFETFGVVFIEAMALGKPVIASKNTGPEEFVHSQNGYLVNIDDVEDLANKIEDSYLNKKVWKSRADKIKEEVWNKYSEQAIVKSLEEVYNNV
ncbi:glycosyltransferase family 4 protein [Lunatimonas salinarum]|uniref:glycosyltransferase family 4 protein n=1 Tax=Lunatimonas salinarum TaxID=1774590 RepID=UPI001ADF2BB7|nr:glycosyltransferase family 4 protein [Lunatimonas salinarum]